MIHSIGLKKQIKTSLINKNISKTNWSLLFVYLYVIIMCHVPWINKNLYHKMLGIVFVVVGFLTILSIASSTAASNECIFPHESRYDCGYSEITQQECEAKGCCHNSSISGDIAPHCFYPLAAECADQVERFDCGFYGIDVHLCHEKGCCFNSSVSEGPHCFFKQLTECDFPATERYDCGYPGISKDECLSRGCCHDTLVPNVPWCFHKTRSPCDVPNEEKRDCGYYGITQEECLARECCHIPVDGYASCYPTAYDPFTKFRSSGDVSHDIWFLTHRTMLTFTVETCKNAYIHLRQTGHSDKNQYKIQFGLESANDVRLEKFVNGTRMGEPVQETVADVVNCNEGRSFYVEWMDGTVKVGRSSSDIFLTYSDSHPMNIVEIKAYTSGTSGYWTFNNNMGRGVNVAQRANLNYQELWMELRPQITSLVVTVWAHEEAYIILAENFENKDIAYEIGLGTEDNQKSYVLDKTIDMKETVYTPDILQGTRNPVDIWIDWTEGFLQMGYGHIIGVNTFLLRYFEDSRVYTVRYVSTGHLSLDQSDMAYFTFRYLTEPLYYFRTPPQPTDPDDGGHFVKRVHVTTHITSINFRVAACQSAHVYLSDTTNKYRVEFVIGAYNNEETALFELPTGEPEIRHTPGILSCHHGTNFWISWHDGIPAIGRGTVVGEHTLVRLWGVTLHDDVTGIGFRTSHDWGEWELAETQVSGMVLQPVTYSSHMRTDQWRDVSMTSYTFLRAQACEGLHVLFTAEPGVVDAGATVEVILGAEGNTNNYIRRGPEGEVLSSYKKTGILDCNMWHWFWFDWGGENFRVGAGTEVGVNQFLIAALSRFSSLLRVRTMGVALASADTQQQALLEFSQPIGESMTFFSKHDLSRELTLITEKEFFTFEVRACFDARVLLQGNPDSMSSDLYTIFFGTADNMHLTIQRDGMTLKSVKLDRLLECDETRPFWITWHDKQIQIGESWLVGQRLLLHYSPNNPADFIVPLHAVSLQSFDHTNPARWQVPKNTALNSQIKTGAEVSWQQYWLSVDSTTGVVFTVRSPVEAWLALSEAASAPGLYTTRELKIADTTVLRDSTQEGTTVLVEVSSSNIVSDEEDRHFWVSWANGVFQFGKGSVIGGSMVLEYQETQAHHFTTLSITGGSQAEAYWTFPSHSETFAEVQTHSLLFSEFRYTALEPEFRFSVQACRSAHIAMLSGQQHGTGSQSKSYELVIGGEENTITYIKRSDDTQWSSEQQIDSPDILHCYEPRDFTLTWGAGGVTLIGEGGFFFTYYDPEPLPVEYLSFGTDYITGRWYINRAASDSVYVKTFSGEQLQASSNLKQTGAKRTPEPDNAASNALMYEVPGIYKYSFLWISTSGIDSIWFSVRACAEAHVILTRYYGVPDYSSYEIRIGEHNNQYINVYTDRTDKCGTVLRNPVLDCQQFRTFWVRWVHQQVQVGTGHIPGTGVLVSCDTPSDFTVRGLAVSSGGANDAEWIFEDITSSETFAFWTRNEYPDWAYNHTWLTPTHKWLTFEVQTKEWATLDLCSTPHVTDTQCFEVHIGKQDSIDASRQISFIVNIDQPESPVAKATTPQALADGASNAFWLSWEQGVLRVGYGGVVQPEAAFLQTNHSLPFTVSGIGFATPRADSRWKVPVDLARQIRVPLENTGHMYQDFDVSLRGRNSMVFQVKSNDAVYVVLEGDTGSQSYTLVLGDQGNTYTRLLDGEGNSLQSVKTVGVLNTDTEQTYWVAWRAGVLEFGRGGQLDREVVIQQQVGDGSAVAFRRALCQCVTQSEWVILDMQGMTYNLMTSEVHAYDVAWMYVSYHPNIEFNVQACNDAFVLLSGVEGVNNYDGVYEIVIGSSANTMVRIRRNSHHDDVAAVEYKGLLHCDWSRRFWVSWAEGLLAVGTGWPGSGHVLITWQDSDPLPVHYAAVASGWGADAKWSIVHTQSERLSLQSPPTTENPYNTSYIVVQGDDYIRFEVQACEKACIALLQVPGTPSVFMYELILGHEGGKGVLLRADYMAFVDAANIAILDCSSKKEFWVSWSATGGIRVGSSLQSGESEIAWFKNAPRLVTRINSVAFRLDGGEAPGYWVYHGSGRMYEYPGVPSSDGMSTGVIVGIVLAVLVVIVIVVTVLFVMVPSAKVKAIQYWITVSSKLTSRNTDSIDTRVFATEVGFTGTDKGFGEEHTA